MISTPPSFGSSPTASSSGASFVAKPFTWARSAMRVASSSALPRLEPYSTSSGVLWPGRVTGAARATLEAAAGCADRPGTTVRSASLRGRTLILKPSGLIVSVSFSAI